MRVTRILMGAIMLIAGAVWFLQGIGVLRGSTMTGSMIWVVIGALVVIAGVTLLRQAFAGPKPPKA
ncbi:MAG TPA: hypothetical protein VNM16_13235 [Bacillota bacterium]|nr:hypothetical protein [Bacillota bacterium]